jgi:hypothetical protein
MSMIVAVNKVYEHEGKEYHVQAEDLGSEQACFEVRVYQSGAVLWRKRIMYTELLARGLPQLEQDDELRVLMEKMITTVQAAIAKGKLA